MLVQRLSNQHNLSNATRVDGPVQGGQIANLHDIHPLAIFLEPFVPETAAKIWDILNIDEKISWAGLNIELNAGHETKDPVIVAEKIDIKEIMKKYEEMKND